MTRYLPRMPSPVRNALILPCAISIRIECSEIPSISSVHSLIVSILTDCARALTGFDDVEIVSIQITDAQGNVCPNNDCSIELKVEGAELIAVDNADVLAHETSHKSPVFNTYQGRMIAYIRRTSASGKVTVTATDCSSAAALKESKTF